MNSKQQNQNLFSTAFPTHPIQDKLGQLLIQFGFTKLEIATLIVSGAVYNQSKGEMLPETIAQESVEIAKAILFEVDNYLESTKDNQKNTTPIIKL
jgi:hypothetical protein